MPFEVDADWQELSRLYELAEPLQGDALLAFLAAVPEPQQRFLPRLAELLRANAEAEDRKFLRDLPQLFDDRTASDSGWMIGDFIGPYRLRRRLGAGGMAEVWEAERSDGAFERTVALKLLYNHPLPNRRDAFTNRFARERDILASLDHPNVAGLHDAGVMDDGQAWLALEFIAGETITVWADAGTLTIRQRVQAFRQVLVAVAYAHANLVIHRDLKPSNILVTAEGDVRLLDFGIAKLMEPEGGTLLDTALTLHAGRPLTPQYASPEQLMGKPLSVATDIYSLGVVLYELLTGVLPYNVRVADSGLLDISVLNTEIKAPSRSLLTDAAASSRGTDMSSLRRLLRPDLDAIALKALEASRERRYESVGAMRADVDRWLENRPVLATIPSPTYRMRKFVRRNPRLVGASLLSVFLIFGLLGAVGLSARQARQDAVRAAKVKDFLLEMFNLSDPNQSAGTDIKASAVVAAGLERAQTMLGDEPELQAEVLESIGNIQQNIGRYSEAEPIFEKAALLYDKAENRLAWTKVKLVLVDNELQMGDFRAARHQLELATVDMDKFTSDLDVQVERHRLKGLILRSEGKGLEARDELAATVINARKAYGERDARLLNPLGDLALAEIGLHHFDEARKVVAEEKRVVSRLAKPKATEIVGAEFEAAYVEEVAGNYRESEALAATAISHCDQTLGQDAENCLILRHVMIDALMHQREFERCMEYLPALLRAAENDQSPRRRDEAIVGAAQIVTNLNRMGEFPALKKRLDWLAHEPPEKLTLDPITMPLPTTLAAMALAEGDLKRFQEVLGPLPAAPAKPNPATDSPAAVFLKGLALQMTGRDEEALLFLRLSHDSTAKRLGKDHSSSILIGLNQVKSLARLGRQEEARAMIAYALPILRPRMDGNAALIRQLEQADLSTSSGADVPGHEIPTLVF